MLDGDSDGGSHSEDGGNCDQAAEPSPSLSIDELFALLAHPHRREILYFFDETDETVVDFATILDRLEQRSEKAEHAPDREELRLSVLHTHLPHMEDIGLIDYDQRSQEIRYWHDPALEKWLAFIRQADQ